MDYTAEIYKRDARTKAGERLLKKDDMVGLDSPVAAVQAHLSTMYPASKGYRVEVHETWVTRKNLLSGEDYTERYDTPRYCSPSSESYWSM